jgi:hypothetical protein
MENDLAAPVFYNLEASGLNGCPIEVGWAWSDVDSGAIHSDSYLIRPPLEWDVAGTWDPRIATRHGISIDHLSRRGRPILEILRRLNEALVGREVYADSPFSEPWLRQLFDSERIEPDFSVRRTHPVRLFIHFGCDQRLYAAAKRQALRIAPLRHRAEADARHWAVMWAIVASELRNRHQREAPSGVRIIH